ncbi:hypothetical protein, partial [Salmonella sp. gx-f7]|uniref:hypothetical protein n=1 Tax=Salmonella sp. gx-f7 TaxID=2582606 RepID=UPI001F251EB6
VISPQFGIRFLLGYDQFRGCNDGAAVSAVVKNSELKTQSCLPVRADWAVKTGVPAKTLGGKLCVTCEHCLVETQSTSMNLKMSIINHL